jgi:hypothetical protein
MAYIFNGAGGFFMFPKQGSGSPRQLNNQLDSRRHYQTLVGSVIGQAAIREK